MKIKIFITSLILSLFLVSAPLVAHHNFQAEFDRDLPVVVTGTVVRFELTNPHARLYIQEVDENGETINWNFELTAASNLLRRGWRRDSVNPGDTVTVNADRAINHPNVGNARRVTLINEEGENTIFGQVRD
jgi:hypothetical protein